MSMASDFYLRYYVGHKGKFGHEFLEFEFRPDGEHGEGPPDRRLNEGTRSEIAPEEAGLVGLVNFIHDGPLHSSAVELQNVGVGVVLRVCKRMNGSPVDSEKLIPPAAGDVVIRILEYPETLLWS